MFLQEWARSQCYMTFPLCASRGIERALILYAGKLLIFKILFVKHL